ncbi:MAG TPA: hemolysin III family protein, partial [Thermoanaerobaculia bacterium]|nr:hemolysin III family protein [Thermoanaerobaculia bacterium]
MVQGERFNSITHLVGTVLAVIGTSIAVTLAAMRTGARATTGVAIYGGMLVILYLSSTLYHSLHGKAKNVFRVLDHASIYLLIAGTYTPFTLVTLRGPLGWWLFGIVWTLAAIGVAKDVFFHGRFRGVSIALYVIMGWMILAAIGPLQRALPIEAIVWLAVGGVFYTAGIVFYAQSTRV